MQKPFFLMTLLFVFAHLAYGQTPSYKILLGKWEGTDEKNKTGAIEFLDSNKMTMSFKGSAPRALMYSIDLTRDVTRNPVRMDLYRDSSSKAAALKCLIQLTGPNSLKWQVFPGGDRPENFDEGSPGTMIVMQRKN